jgi:hypothetical protein
MCILSILKSEPFWVFITAITTVVLAYIAQNQLSINNKIASATFLNEFKGAFFTEQQRIFILLIENKWLSFDENEGIFINNVTKDYSNKFPTIAFLQRKYYLTQEFDDYLLGHFEDAALLEESKMITISDAEQHFGYYLSVALEDDEIKKYVAWAKQDNSDIYSRTLTLHEKLKNL